jgi:hypothetical protein
VPIPPEFSFSQNNLQDFLDCPCRFELRYLQRQAWPAIRSEPVLEHEHHMQRGERFHQMIHQHQLGLPAEQIGAQANEALLSEWWLNYLDLSPQPLPAQRFPEYSLRAPFSGYQLIAKYDLLAIQPGERAVIVDWKTGLRKPTRAAISRRVQTRLYPLLLLEAGHHLNLGYPFDPAQIEMVYWFTADPLHPEYFVYSAERYEQDKRFLSDLIDQVEQNSKHIFPLTGDERFCRFCNYRSLCQRGVKAAEGDPDDINMPDDFNFDLDFDQIAEIEF